MYSNAFLETITLSVSSGASTAVAALDDQIAALQHARRAIRLASDAFVVVGLLLLGSALISGCPQSQPWRVLSAQTLLLSALLFVLGITIPLVRMTVTGHAAGLGSALIAAPSRGVLAAIGDLWSHRQPLLALLMLGCSVALPVIKLGLAAWVLAAPRPQPRLIRLLEAVGRWAMADVFVVAVLIVVCSPLEPGALLQTQVRAGMGLAFFAAAAGLSMLAPLLLGRSVAAQRSAPGPGPRLLGGCDDA